MDKRIRADVFRTRLQEAMSLKKVTRSALSRAANVDRSTIGQLLKNDYPRLPNAQLAADIAGALSVSTDWLLGLTNRPEAPGDIVAAAMSLSPAERTSADEQLLEWHREAEGYKVRHVPATLPDILKTERMLQWEYASFREKRLPEAFAAMQNQLQWLSSGVSDYEIALPLHEIEACAAGTAYYKGVSRDVRFEQLNFLPISAIRCFRGCGYSCSTHIGSLAHRSLFSARTLPLFTSANAISHSVKSNA